MRLRHIEHAWEGIRHLRDLNIYLRDIAVHVPRLRHLLWSGYVREASEAVKQMLAPLDQHAGLRDANGNRASIRIDQQSWHLCGPERSFDRQLLPAILVRPADIQFTGGKCCQQPRQCPHEQASDALVADCRSSGSSSPSSRCGRPSQKGKA